MAINGKQVKNQILTELLAWLWLGKVERAIKQNGMSWSAHGSTSLATLTTVRRNEEDRHWLLKRDICFTFDAATQRLAA